MADLNALSHEILSRSEAALRTPIQEIPERTYHNEAVIDTFDGKPAKPAVAVTPKNGEVLIEPIYGSRSRVVSRRVPDARGSTRACRQSGGAFELWRQGRTVHIVRSSAHAEDQRLGGMVLVNNPKQYRHDREIGLYR